MGFLKGFGRKSGSSKVSPADYAHELAGAFIGSMADAGVTAALDYSQESVFRLDGLVAHGWPDGASADTLRTLAPAMGAYLGEVMVRHLGGTWVEGMDGFSVRFRGAGDIDPVAVVRRRFAGTEQQYIAMFYAALRHRLGLDPT